MPTTRLGRIRPTFVNVASAVAAIAARALGPHKAGKEKDGRCDYRQRDYEARKVQSCPLGRCSSWQLSTEYDPVLLDGRGQGSIRRRNGIL